MQCRELDDFRANYSLGDYTLEEYLQAISGGPDLKYRKIMDWATERKNREGQRRMLALGKLLYRMLKEADNIWFDKLAR